MQGDTVWNPHAFAQPDTIDDRVLDLFRADETFLVRYGRYSSDDPLMAHDGRRPQKVLLLLDKSTDSAAGAGAAVAAAEAKT